MMIATILLIANLISLIAKDKVIFSFIHFIWIYPLELLFWFLLIVLITVVGALISD